MSPVDSVPCTVAAFVALSAEILRTGAAVRFQAHGASMWPLVRDGDVLLIRPVSPNALRVGDVVLCGREPGRTVVHRVVRVTAGADGPRFTVQGDALPKPDGTFSAAQIYGRVTVIERNNKEIELDGPAMRLLGWAAVLRSRRRLGRGDGRGRPYRLALQAVKRLPGLRRYLA